MTTEIEPVRSNSPELSAMTLPKLKTVATQLGVDGAAKMKKDALVEAIADLQAKNREAAKAEREARREARNKNKKEARAQITLLQMKIQMMMAMIHRQHLKATQIVATVGIALIATTAMLVDVIATVIATVTEHHAKSVNQYLVKTMS